MSDIIHGFKPVFDANSELLVLGSFPSVKSRAIDFYYGNRQNRFWKMLYGYFGESLQEGVDAKKDFVLRRHVALWDVISSCEIVGSSDASIANYTVADIRFVVQAAPIRMILLNGAAAYKIFSENFGGIGVPYLRMPSTSPANPRYEQGVWHAALDSVFKPAKQ